MSDTKKRFNRLGVMLDCSRNAVLKVSAVKNYIDLISDMGYNTLMLYTEDTFEVENNPYFGHMRGRYSFDEMREMDEYASQKGVELIPAIQTLAHLGPIFRWNCYSQINDCDDILMCDDERTYRLIDDMFATIKNTLKTKTVNIGMDEAYMLGRGKYQDKNGIKNRFDILLNHLKKVAEIADKYGFKCIMWGDMFFKLIAGADDYYSTENDIPEEIRGMIPHNVDLIYWDYYSTETEHFKRLIERHKKIKDNIWFAGGLWTWTGYAPHNGYTIAEVKAAFEACEDTGVKDVILTCWGDDGAECSRFSMLPSLYYASELAKGNNDEELIKKGFYEKFGIEFEDFMLLDMQGTPNTAALHTVNSDKYFLYNDYFLGICDSMTSEIDCNAYRELSKKLEKPASDPRYGHLFETIKALSDVLAIKSNLGLRLRTAYTEGDKVKLNLIVDDFKTLEDLLEKFYSAIQKQWNAENRSFGFEVLDIRLGGLIRRTKHCKERLVEYLSGETEKIEELEQPMLDLQGRALEESKPVLVTRWSKAVTVGYL